MCPFMYVCECVHTYIYIFFLNVRHIYKDIYTWEYTVLEKRKLTDSQTYTIIPQLTYLLML